MDVERVLQNLLVLSSIIAAAYSVWRVKKLAPLEQTEKDAMASAAYADAATKAANQVSDYLNRIEKLEEKLEAFENKQEKLEDTLRSRDKCIDTLNKEIKRRDDLIAEWANGIRILIDQLEQAHIIPAWKPKDFT
jgi:peptidoglycan hydrolase CwlO-like protein